MLHKIIAICLSGLFAFQIHATSIAHLSSTLTAQQAQQDVEQWIDFIEKTHPDLSYTVKDVEQFYKKVDGLKKQFEKPILVKDFWLEMMTLNSELSDGHLSLTPPKLAELAREHIANGGALFPFRVVFDGDDLVIKSKLNKQHSSMQGYKIHKINGVAIAEILAPLFQRTHGDSLIQQRAILQTRFSEYYWLYYGNQTKFVIDVENDHVINNVTLDLTAQSPSDVISLDKSFEKTFNFEVKNNAGVLTAKSFRYYKDKEKFNQFFKSVFQKIKSQKLDHLVIDIRGNGGGDDTWKQGILPYIADKPWRTGSKYKLKVLEGQADKDNKVGDVVEGEVTKFTQVDNDNALKFRGKVSVLVDGFTYSSSILFINVMQDFGFGHIVGDVIGGKRGQTGGTKKLVLPNSKLKTYSPRFLLERPNGGNNLDTVTIDKKIKYDPTQPDELLNKLLAGY